VPALDRVSRLRPVSFSWRAAEFPTQGFGNQREIGLVAQEVEAVFPALVATSPEGWKTVDYSALPILAVQAIKELTEKNDALEQEVAAIRIALTELTAAAKNDRR
jgi:predicted methyltransferase